VALTIIGAGFGRTGTSSLKAALEHLGFDPCYHMREVTSPERVAQWWAAADGRPDWEALFAGYRAAVDWPAAAFWRPLTERYPSAKVILSVRDPEQWYDSVMSTIYPSSTAPSDDPERRRFMAMVGRVVWSGIFDGRIEERAYALQVYARHLEDVQRSLPSERLLIFTATDGWEPLCAFLDVPVPPEPYPRLNDRASFLARRAAGDRTAKED
jgi:hypothetical protein